MANFPSAKVAFTEVDRSRLATDQDARNLLVAGTAPKGPLIPTVIGSPTQFRRVYGYDPDSFLYHAANIICSYGSLLVVRAVGALARCAGVRILHDLAVSGVSGEEAFAGGDAVYDPETVVAADLEADEILRIFAYSPGTWPHKGSDYEIKVAVITSADYDDDTSFYINNPPTESDEFVIIVLDSSDNILETHKVTRIRNKTDMYGSMYVEDRINGNSEYIFVKDNTTIPVDVVGVYNIPYSTILAHVVTPAELTEGVDATPTAGEISIAYNKAENSSVYDFIGILSIGNTDLSTYTSLINLAEITRTRLYLDNPYSVNTVAEMLTYRATTLNCSSSRVALYFDWQEAYDNVSSRYVWLPPTIFVGAAIAYMCKYGEAWYAPAGEQYGKIFSAVRARTEIGEADRDNLYSHQINPLSAIPGLGRRIWGDKTQQKFLSSMSYIGCRTALDIIEDAVEQIAYTLLFRPNNKTTRTMLEDGVNPFLRQMVAKNGLATYIPIYVGDDIQTSEEILTARLQVDMLESVQGIQINVEIVRGQTVLITEA